MAGVNEMISRCRRSYTSQGTTAPPNRTQSKYDNRNDLVSRIATPYRWSVFVRSIAIL